MESAFGVVLFVVVFLGAIAAVISFFGSWARRLGAVTSGASRPALG